MSSRAFDSIILFGVLAAILVVGPLVAWVIRKKVLKHDRLDAPLRCMACGYDLTGQTMPRCPECGVAVGFDKSFKELGIDEDQVIRHVESKRQADGQVDR